MMELRRSPGRVAQLHLFTAQLRQLGFTDVAAEHLQVRVAPSVAHIPSVTMMFMVADFAFGTRQVTPARRTNVPAPVLLPLVGVPLGPMPIA
jgi:hypothetical protein